MKVKFLFLSIMILPFQISGQDTLYGKIWKSRFSIQAGLYYKTFCDKRYIEPKLYKDGDEFTDHQYERFKKMPTMGFNLGCLFTLRSHYKWSITSGLQYFFNKDILENNQDSVIKYGNGSSIRDIHNVLKYDYSNNYLLLPVLFHYSSKKTTVYAGCSFALITYKTARYTYVVNQFPNNPRWGTAHKRISGFEMPLKIFPAIQVSYDIKIKNINTSPYLAFYYAVNSFNDLLIQAGVYIPLHLHYTTFLKHTK